MRTNTPFIHSAFYLNSSEGRDRLLMSHSQIQRDATWETFTNEATQPLGIVAMTGAGFAFKASNIFLSHYASPLLNQSGLLIRILARGGIRSSALACEVATYRAISQGFSQVFRSREFATDFLSFGILKCFGAIAQGQNVLLTHFSQSAGMVTGHNLAYGLGLATRPQGNLIEQFTHAEATNLKLLLGMSFVNGFAPGLSRFERRLDLDTSFISARRNPGYSLSRVALLRMASEVNSLAVIDSWRERYEAELEHLSTSETPYQRIAADTLYILNKRDIEQTDYLNRASEAIRVYEQRKFEIGQALLSAYRGVLPQVRGLFTYLRAEDRENRIVETIWGEKDPSKIPCKLLDRQWLSMGPFTDIVRGKLILRNPYDAPWVMETIEGYSDRVFKVRRERNERGDLTNRLDQEPFDRLLNGYNRGARHFALRRMKTIFDLQSPEGGYFPFELQILSRYFERWGEIQRRLVKDNKISSPEEREVLDVYCNNVAEWLAQIEQRGVPRAVPRFEGLNLYHLFPEHLLNSLNAMEAFVEEVEMENSL